MFIHRLNAVRSALNLPWVGNGIIKPRGLKFHDILDEMDRVAQLRTRAIGFSIPPYQDIAPVNQPAKLTSYPVSPWVPVGTRLARLERHVFGEEVPQSPPKRETPSLYHWLGVYAEGGYPTLRPGMDF